MKELLRRLAVYPGSTFLLLFATLFANVLGLATPIFVMQVINRYVGVGVTSTLVTLAAGALVAALLEFVFRLVRHGLAAEHLARTDRNMILGLGAIVSNAAPHAAREHFRHADEDLISDIQRTQTAYSPTNLCAVLDLPFAFLFVGAVYFLSPQLGMLAISIATLVLLVTLVLGRLREQTRQDTAKSARERARQLRYVIRAGGVIRSFVSSRYLQRFWRDFAGDQIRLTEILGNRQSRQQAVMAFSQAILSLCLISFGAYLVVHGDLDVGAMIGANILAIRALAPIHRMAGMIGPLRDAAESTDQIRKLARMPSDQGHRGALLGFRGDVKLRGLGFAHAETRQYVFQNLAADFAPNSLSVISGPPGSGRGQLLSIVAGLGEASAGNVLADGVNVSQLPFDWWRRQCAYVPRDPVFLNASLRENFDAAYPGVDEEAILDALQQVGLRAVIDQHPDGLDFELRQEGGNLPPNARVRLAIARALVSGGQLVLLDDVLGALQGEERGLVLQLIDRLVREGRTVVAVSNEEALTQRAHQVIDFSVKPIPRVTVLKPIEAPAVQAGDARDGETRAAADDDADELQERPHSATPARLLVLTTCIAGVAVGIWTYQAELDVTSVAEGEVIPSARLQTVDSLEGGIITEIMVREGDAVAIGQPLLVLSSVQDDASVEELQLRLASNRIDVLRLRAELARAETLEFPDALVSADPDGIMEARELFQTRMQKLADSIATQEQIIRQRESDIRRAETEVETTRASLALVEDQIEISEGLLRLDLTNRMLHLDLLREKANLDAILRGAQSRLPGLRAALEEARIRVRGLESEFNEDARTQLQRAEREIGELQARLGRFVDTQRRRTLRAPVDGIVKSLSTNTIGAVVRPAETVVELVPQDDELLVEAKLPTSEIGFVENGMPVVIRLPGANAVRLGEIQGTVIRISPDAIERETGETYFVVVVRTDQMQFEKRGRTYRLTPGVKVSCSIVTGQRRVYEYLFDPFIRGLVYALGER